jgi:hypothetical protein
VRQAVGTADTKHVWATLLNVKGTAERTGIVRLGKFPGIFPGATPRHYQGYLVNAAFKVTGFGLEPLSAVSTNLPSLPTLIPKQNGCHFFGQMR